MAPRLPAASAGLVAVLAGAAFPAQAAQEGAARRDWLVELKRQATSRGTPEETTKTNLKLD